MKYCLLLVVFTCCKAWDGTPCKQLSFYLSQATKSLSSCDLVVDSQKRQLGVNEEIAFNLLPMENRVAMSRGGIGIKRWVLFSKCLEIEPLLSVSWCEGQFGRMWFQMYNIFGYLPAPVNSADSTEFTGTFTIPHLDNEYTNQTRSLHNILFRISR